MSNYLIQIKVYKYSIQTNKNWAKQNNIVDIFTTIALKFVKYPYMYLCGKKIVVNFASVFQKLYSTE